MPTAPIRNPAIAGPMTRAPLNNDELSAIAFVIEMVGKDDLMNAIALNSSLFNGARVIGPAIAGFLISVLSIAWSYFLNGLSYIAVIAGLLLMRLPYNPSPPKTTSEAGPR